jgi:hypothetical protein
VYVRHMTLSHYHGCESCKQNNIVCTQVSAAAKDLVQKLLNVEPTARLGAPHLQGLSLCRHCAGLSLKSSSYVRCAQATTAERQVEAV